MQHAGMRTEAHRTDRRLEIGGVCGHREVGRVTPCPRAGALQPGTHSEQDKKWSLCDETRHAADNQTGERPRVPPAARDRQGRQKPWRRTGPSLPKTVRHPTDAAEMRPFSGNCRPSDSNRRQSHRADSPSAGSHTGHDGPSCLQDPRGAIRHRDQPPKQNENPVRHSLNLAHPLVLAVNSRTRRILAIHYAPAFPSGLPEAPQFVKCCFPCGKRTRILYSNRSIANCNGKRSQAVKPLQATL